MESGRERRQGGDRQQAECLQTKAQGLTGHEDFASEEGEGHQRGDDPDVRTPASLQEAEDRFEC
jgi:hypothetical protein